MLIRSAAKAIIIRDGHLLALIFQRETGIYYALPGGGQDPEESLREAVVRECMEEINCVVEAGELLFVRDFIRSREAREDGNAPFHQVDHFFRCTLQPGSEPGVGPVADPDQTGVGWIPLEKLADIPFYPAAMIPWLMQLDAVDRPVYLGAVD